MPALTIGFLFADDVFDLEAVRRTLPECEITALPDCQQWDEATLANRLRSYDAVVTSRRSPRLPDSLVADRGRLRLLAHCHGTVKHLVSKRHIEAGLCVSNWGDAVAGVAEGAMALLFACLKQLRALDHHIRSDWKDDRRIWQDFPATLSQRPVGLYGFGPIGRHMGRFLQIFGAQVAIYDPYAKDIPAGVRVCTSLRELFAGNDIVSIHCGLNDQTRGSVTRELLELLPQGGILINTARGPIVDEAGLVAVLDSRRIVAGLDVIEDEKRWAQGALAQQPSERVLLTGHILGNGRGPAPDSKVHARLRPLPEYVVENLRALGEGRPLINLIPPEIYDLKT